MDAGTIKVIFIRDIYTEVVEKAILGAEHTVWIATADLKDLHVRMSRGYRPLLELFEEMAKR